MSDLVLNHGVTLQSVQEAYGTNWSFGPSDAPTAM